MENEFLFQALRIVNNRSLEDALAVVFGETPNFSAEPAISVSGASVEEATQIPYESVCSFISQFDSLSLVFAFVTNETLIVDMISFLFRM